MQVRAVERWCSGCADETVFEAPPCEDGHGADCLDLACVDCGAAITVGVLLVAAEVRLAVQAA